MGGEIPEVLPTSFLFVLEFNHAISRGISYRDFTIVRRLYVKLVLGLRYWLVPTDGARNARDDMYFFLMKSNLITGLGVFATAILKEA